MSDRMRLRPKSTASARGVQLNYSGVKTADSWKCEMGGLTTWSLDNSGILGVQGSRCMPQTWQMKLNAQSGGFLPVLKGKGKTPSSNKSLKRTKSATARHTTSTGGKITSSNTASLLDLTSIVPSQKKPIAKLYRQNSLSVDFQMLTQPALRYSHDSGVASVLSKLDLLEQGIHRSVSSSALTSNSADTKLSESSAVSDNNKTNDKFRDTILDSGTTSHLSVESNIPHPSQTPQKSTSFENAELLPAPPSTPRADSTSEQNDIKNYIDNSDTRSVKEDKWKLKVTVPDSVDDNIDDAKLIEETSSTSPDEIQAVNDINSPTTKPPSNEVEPPTKKTADPLVHLQNRPKPPSARPLGSSGGSKKRISRAKTMETKEIGSENSADNFSESDTTSVELENDSPIIVNTSKSKLADLPKSVRFPDQPANIKEYYPWEPPLNSIVYHDYKPPPRKPVPKSTPIFRP